MTHTLTAKEQSLSKIFGDDYVFTIPGYQRPYAWGTDQARELLDDLLQALSDAPSQLSDSAPYFLGSIVLIKNEASPEATVVDGQQRLTTLTLLLSAIRAVVKGTDVQAGITKRIYEHGDVVSATAARYRLSLRERDRDFFRQFVQHEGALLQLAGLNTRLPDAQSRLQANAKVFLDTLSQLDEVKLVRLVQFIITRCYLVTVATPDLDSAYRIFGILNSRGLDLSATDILKADIIGGISAAERDAYTQKWEDEEEDLGREAFGDLFSHIRMIHRKAKPQGTLLKEFKQHVAPEKQPKDFMDGVLVPMAEAFSVLTSASYASTELAEEVNEHLVWLNRLEFKDWLPPSLVFYVRHKNEPASMLAFFASLERLGFSMLARKSGVNERIERFSKLTEAIEKKVDLDGASSPLQLTPIEQFETYTALSGPIYDTHSPRTLAVLLLRLDRLLSDATATYKHDVVSVEHVLPQQPAPNSEWLSWVPDPLVHQFWVHRLGNLALLSRNKNSAASNYEFSRKKNAYFAKGGVSSFSLTTQVLQHANWTEEVMKERQAAMLAKLEEHWKLQGRKSKGQLAQEKLEDLKQTGLEAAFELESTKHGLVANAVELGDSFAVLAGSQAKLTWSGQDHSYKLLREQLISDGTLKKLEEETCFVFTKDFPFKKPSAASATVLGRTDNGRTTWRLKGTSVTYAAWQENLPAGMSPSGQGDD